MKTKCWKCGKTVDFDMEKQWENHRLLMSRSGDIKTEEEPPKHIWLRVFCTECRKKNSEENIKNKLEYIRHKACVLRERALKILERQQADIYKYKPAIDAVTEFLLEQPGKFDSAHEIVAAIILVHHRVGLKLQFKIHNYRVDFLINKHKCVLEIDGDNHNGQLLYDSNRDIKIRKILGNEWEVVRIPNKYLESNADRLYDAIKTIKKEKQEARAKNNGILPPYYSKRDLAKSRKAYDISHERYNKMDSYARLQEVQRMGRA